MENLFGKGSTAYCQNLQDDQNYFSFNTDDPGTFTYIGGNIAINFLAGGCFVEDVWYGCEYSGDPDYNSLIWTIDKTTGDMTQVGYCGEGLNGIAYDDSAGVLYGCSGTDLFTIDTVTGDATPVGPMGNAGLMIGIACDSSGNLYGEDITDDQFYSINKATGVATAIGPLGININFAQDMAFDKINDICYITGYKGSTNGGGALYSINIGTGEATFIGDFPIGSMSCPSEIACFAIPYFNMQGADLDCSGDLDFGDVETTTTVTATITVENVGDSGSLLSWEVESFPDWGDWDFDPESGTDVEPGTPATINVEVVVPEETETTFTGEVVLVNTADPSDTCTVATTLTTPLSQEQDSFSSMNFLQRILERFPILKNIFQQF